MLACGLFLIGLMGVIAVNIAPQMLHPGQDIGGSTWTGTAEQGRMALTLFSMVIAFGLVATLTEAAVRVEHVSCASKTAAGQQRARAMKQLRQRARRHRRQDRRGEGESQDLAQCELGLLLLHEWRGAAEAGSARG